jgi:hypothetical protein
MLVMESHISVTFQGTFPATTWILKKLTGRFARWFYLSCLVIALVPAILLRIEAAVFANRTSRVMSALSELQVGISSKAEVLSRIPALKPTSGPYSAPQCDADECLSSGISNLKLSNNVMSTVGGIGNRTLFSALNVLGFRPSFLDVYVNVAAGRVSLVSYQLLVSTPQLNDPPVVIAVNSRDHIPARFVGDESPTYKVHRSWREPSRSIGIILTPAAPDELKRNAFAPRLGCLWSLTGCRTWHQLLPDVKE